MTDRPGMAKPVEDLVRENRRALNKLAKWRKFFTSWQLGTRPDTDGECRAVSNHRELSILLRAEVSALTGLMLAKGVFTAEEFTEALTAEALQLDHDYEEQYPGWSSGEHGLNMVVPAALETMRRLGFPP